jgi:hypothetical protein
MKPRGAPTWRHFFAEADRLKLCILLPPPAAVNGNRCMIIFSPFMNLLKSVTLKPAASTINITTE